MSSSGPFLEQGDDGTWRIAAERLTAVVAGLVAGEYFASISALIEAVFAIPIGIIEWAGQSLGAGVSGLLAVFTAPIATAWAQLLPFLRDLGPLAFPFAIMAVLVIAYVGVQLREVADG